MRAWGNAFSFSHIFPPRTWSSGTGAKEPHERSWGPSGQILWLLATGHSAAVIVEVTGYVRYWIGQLVKRYNGQGPAGMHNRQRTTSWRPLRMLSAAHKASQLQRLG